MKKPSVLALAFAVLFASAVTASAQDVRYNFDKQANFAQFKTYKWVTAEGRAGAERSRRLADQGRRSMRSWPPRD